MSFTWIRKTVSSRITFKIFRVTSTAIKTRTRFTHLIFYLLTWLIFAYLSMTNRFTSTFCAFCGITILIRLTSLLTILITFAHTPLTIKTYLACFTVLRNWAPNMSAIFFDVKSKFPNIIWSFSYTSLRKSRVWLKMNICACETFRSILYLTWAPLITQLFGGGLFWVPFDKLFGSTSALSCIQRSPLAVTPAPTNAVPIRTESSILFAIDWNALPSVLGIFI